MPIKPPVDLAALRALIASFPAGDDAAAEAARARDAVLTKPPGALGRLESLAVWLARWQGRARPAAESIRIAVFAGNHGIAAAGVSPYPASVTAQMVANFAAGGAAINALSRAIGAELTVVPLDLERPSADFRRQPALSEAEFIAAAAEGFKVVTPGLDLLCLGEMGIGNTSAAAATAAGLFGGAAIDWVGPGTGAAGPVLAAKIAAVAEAARFHRAETADPLDLARRLGGRELAAMLGACIAARLARVPVVLDGYVATAAVAALGLIRPDGLAHAVAGHCSAEPAHRRLLDALDLPPLLDLGMRLGEASGAAVAAGIIRAAARTHNEMASFGEAGVDGKDPG
ncbi:nicotinate-nucleotide--dimethylbenzimidazole phosphoribosyltransferase [Zavarzinia compransoris]|uniref:Nicotinate-nucleotide--dimethylbenzimidazole phosphoribosyltransferase n=1 Tax=Zavarzinia compransoris TaxID=1264899 RepID=A0A317DVL9_9PROT|nr:nicotinate-nucleotide--dimethylbenzimidazole phosphoribosyltransferase [Zavarzinia compransoris]PWR18729.1 nicotinate-nucleotide--dimethylbenzimidazole phosphoribosyltransferase [Zavarzinia compransoris]TDP48712.1 nicotinate-nucleotide-dimethylbenzimidazole phosphoribosyltransferase [Zavarzinia compransoris]